MNEKHVIPDETYEKLSDLLLHHTRKFNEEKSWKEWSTGGWRIMSNSVLIEILDMLFGADGWTTEQREWIKGMVTKIDKNKIHIGCSCHPLQKGWFTFCSNIVTEKETEGLQFETDDEEATCEQCICRYEKFINEMKG